MRVLSKKSFKEIQQLLPGNYAMLHSILKVKNPGLASSFASYTLLAAAGSGQWTTDAEDAADYRSLCTADAAERDLVAQELVGIDAALKASRLHSQSKKLMEVPDESSIFFRIAPDGSVHVILTAWGFRSVSHTETASTITILLDRGEELKQAQVTVGLVWSDDTPLADTNVTVEVYKTDTPFTTDNAGFLSLGKVAVGQTVTVKLQSGENKVFSVDGRKEAYKLILPWMVTARVTAVDENDSPVSTTLTIDGVNYSTDKEGNIDLPEMLLTPDKSLTVRHASTGDTEFQLTRDSEKNQFKFLVPTPKVDDPWGKKKEEDPHPDPVDIKVRIRIVGKNGQPLVYTPVRVDLKKGYEETVTDADGCVYIEREAFTPGEKARVKVLDSKPGAGAPAAQPKKKQRTSAPVSAPAATPATPPQTPPAPPAGQKKRPVGPSVPPAGTPTPPPIK